MLILINMVNLFCPQKGAAKFFLHHNSMLIDAAHTIGVRMVGHPKLNIMPGNLSSATLPPWMLRSLLAVPTSKILHSTRSTTVLIL